MRRNKPPMQAQQADANIGLFEAIDTQRALRYVKPDPVPDRYVRRIIEAGIKAPSGGNSQPWEFIVIRDPEAKQKLASFYRRAWADAEQGQPTQPDTVNHRSARHLMEHFASAPVMILVCLYTGGENPAFYDGSSIYPSVQNMLLAARGLGLASVLTNGWSKYEPEIRAALGIPEQYRAAALLPIGYPDGVRYGPPRRDPLESHLHTDRW